MALTRDAFPQHTIWGSGGEWAEIARWLSPAPTLVILDLVLGQHSGLAVMESFRHYPSRFLLMSAFYRPALLEQGKALGAQGFVAKSATPEVFWQAIRTVLAGEDFWPPLAWTSASSGKILAPVDRRIIGLVAAGLTNSEIGRRCYLAPGTVRNRLARLMEEWGARNRAQMVRLAIEGGWLDDD